MITPKTRMLEGEELRVLLGAIVHEQPRSVRGPIVPARNLEPLSDRQADEFDDAPDYFDTAYRSARNRAVGVMAVAVLSVGMVLVLAWLLK